MSDQDYQTKVVEMHVALARPFDTVRFKPGVGGRDMPYITARDVMNRLDEVFGLAGWWDEYEQTEHGVICKLSVRMPDGTIVTKSDAGGNAGMQDAGDDDKSAFSDGFKRAAVKYSIGRYLYGNGLPVFMEQHPQPTRGGGSYGGNSAYQNSGDYRQSAPARSGGYNGPQGPPRSGKALFMWTRDQSKEHNFDLLEHINKWSRQVKYPARIVDWDTEQVAAGYAEGCRVLGIGDQNSRQSAPAANDDGPDF